MSNAEPTDESNGAEGRRRRRSRSEAVEYWVWAAVLLAGLFAVTWALIVARLGAVSLYAHFLAVPVLGGLTVPVALWGVMRTVFRPPVVRAARGAGFVLLLAVGFVGNTRLFAAPVSTADWRSDHEYRLPFDGTWYTLSGGPTLARNPHAATAALRWGYDFTRRKNGRRHRGEGEELEDYYCWNEPVLAPVDGRVVAFVDDREDHPPRDPAGSSYFGNRVVLRVDAGEYLYVGFLKRGSIPVSAGEEVEAGDRLGRCGNSGRAFEPRLHVHLQDRLGFPVDSDYGPAEGLPLRFSDYRVVDDGRTVDRGMPRGEAEGGSPPGQRVRRAGGE